MGDCRNLESETNATAGSVRAYAVTRPPR